MRAGRRSRSYLRCAFGGLNIGLAMMVALSLFPGGILQIRDVLEHGYWHARSIAYTGSETARLVEWLRLPGDLIFILLGALPLALAIVLGYRDSPAPAANPARTELGEQRMTLPVRYSSRRGGKPWKSGHR